MSTKRWTPPLANKLRKIGDCTEKMLKESRMNGDYILIHLPDDRPGAGSFVTNMPEQDVPSVLSSMAKLLVLGAGKIAPEEN